MTRWPSPCRWVWPRAACAPTGSRSSTTACSAATTTRRRPSRRACPTVPYNACLQWRSLYAGDIARTHADVVGLLTGRWSITDRQVDGQIVHVGEPAWDDHLVAEYTDIVEFLAQQKVKVVLFTLPFFGAQEAPDGSIYPENQPASGGGLQPGPARGWPPPPMVAVTLVDLNALLEPARPLPDRGGRRGGPLAGRDPRDAGRRAVAAAPRPARGGRARPGRPGRCDPVSGQPDGPATGSGPAPAVAPGGRAHAAGRHARARTSATGTSRVLALDGLRAFALLIIMGYHFGVGWLQGGFFSLDIFYVLSGYLITGLLLGEWARAARIKLGAFWLRRARRLLPALLVVLVVVTLVVRFAYPAGSLSQPADGRPVGPVLLLQLVADRSQSATTSWPPGRCRPSPTPGPWPSRSSSTWCGPWWCWPSSTWASASTGASRSCWGCRCSGSSPRPSRWPCSTAPGPTSPGSTSAPTPTPSPSWWGRCWPVSLTLIQRRRGLTGMAPVGPGNPGQGGPHRHRPGRLRPAPWP